MFGGLLRPGFVGSQMWLARMIEHNIRMLLPSQGIHCFFSARKGPSPAFECDSSSAVEDATLLFEQLPNFKRPDCTEECKMKAGKHKDHLTEWHKPSTCPSASP